ncbi:MAG: hypothetical protein ABI162_00190 [Luteolibacter sp.]
MRKNDWHFIVFINILCSLVFGCKSPSGVDARVVPDKKENTQEVPPWGILGIKNQIWNIGRPILQDPTNVDMKSLYIELGFYEAQRESMDRWIQSTSNDVEFAKQVKVADNFLHFSGDGVSPQLEIERKYDNGIMNLDVFVDNSNGWDDTISWHYLIRYCNVKNKWIFDTIECVHDHKWKM